MIKFYCPVCQTYRDIAPIIATDDACKPVAWADIKCVTCDFVIVTVQAQEAGEYQVVRVVDTTLNF